MLCTEDISRYTKSDVCRVLAVTDGLELGYFRLFSAPFSQQRSLAG